MRSLRQIRRAHGAVLVVATGLWLTGAVQAKTIRVAAGHEIQAAINAAVRGDVVLVAKGTYQENIDFKGKAITVQSTYETDPSAIADTIIDGQRKGSVVSFKSKEPAQAALRGFTITNGTGTLRYHDDPTDTYFLGGGVYCYQSSPTLTDNAIIGNSADYGAGVGCFGSFEGLSPILTGNLISGNATAYGNGGGVGCFEGSSPTLTNNTVSGNSATWGYGGGVYCGESSARLTNNIIAFNEGGGLSTSTGLAVRYCDVYGNTDGNYQGYTPNQTGLNGNIAVDPLFADPAHADYRLRSAGGRWNGSTWVRDPVSSPCVDAGDPASVCPLEPVPNGGRINLGADGNTIFASKSPARWPNKSRIVETNVTYPSVQAAITAAATGQTVELLPGTYAECISFAGKSITVRSTAPTTAAVVKATILDGGGDGGIVVTFNHGETAKSVLSGLTVTRGAPGIYCHTASPTLTNNIIKGNAGRFGGVYCTNSSSPTLTGNTISGNSTEYGGGVNCMSFSSPTLTNNTISGNSARLGGGVLCDRSSPTLTNNTISGNTATNGGGVFCWRSSSPIIRNTIIAFNSPGGGLYVDANATLPSKPVVCYSDLYGNTGGNYLNWPGKAGKSGNISKNPLFANRWKGDLHEKSKGGRWSGSIWVTDTVQSPCINAGDPASAFANEPTPNGGRINMGAYGNTAYASKSAPASATGGLVVSAAAVPAGGGARLSVHLSSAASVAVTITNLAGRPIATLSANDLPEGMSTILWSGKGPRGLCVPEGTYLARLTARTEGGSQCQALAMIAIRR